MFFLRRVVFLLSLTIAPALVLADNHGATTNVRMAAVAIEAVILEIDHEAREFSLGMPNGEIVTLTAGPDIQRLDEFAAGDAIVATYIQSLAGEVRAPTPEEMEEPWVELDAAAIAGMDIEPGVAGIRIIRAVCTIEGMNRVTRTAMIKDPRGKFHLITDVDPANMAGVTLGSHVIMVYSEAMALTLEKAPEAG